MSKDDRQAFRPLALLNRALTAFALIAGGASLAFLTLLGVINVLIMRKALNSPIRGAEDLMVLALVVVVAVAIPFGARTGAHIEIELAEEAMSQRVADWTMAGMKAIGAVVVAILSWRLWLAGGSAAQFGESSQTLIIPFGPFYRLLAASTGFYGIILLLELTALVTGREPGRIHMVSSDTTGDEQ
jgi:TRAP-type C4-dicarboxylate transport system permease small subunit